MENLRDWASQWKERADNIRLTKSWQYLAYIYLALPVLLFLLAFLLRSTAFGVTFGALFHNYGLFIASIRPNFSSFTGILGTSIAIWFLVSAIRRKDWTDLAISTVLIALNCAWYLLEWNYQLLRYLSIM